MTTSPRLSKRKVTLSTSGVVPNLDRLAEWADVSLAVSLHAPNDQLRDEIVPINRKYPIERLLASAKAYLDAQTDKKRVVTIEYTLLAGVNDSVDQAREWPRCSRIILQDQSDSVQRFPDSGYQRPSGNAVSRFWQVLTDAGFVVTVRTTRGDDIDAACGQLVGEVADRTRRAERHRAERAAQTLLESG